MILASFLFLVISLYLDGFFSLACSFFFGNFNFLTLLLIYPFFIKNKTLYLTLLFIFSICYDLLYTNLLFFNTVLYFCIFLISEKYYKKFQVLVIYGYYLLYHLIIFSILYTVGFTNHLYLLPIALVKHLFAGMCYIFLFYVLFKEQYDSYYKKYFGINSKNST